MMKIFWTLLAFLLFTANFVQCEDDEERERDEEKEDNGRVDPSCLRSYGNRNCSQAQQNAAIQKYRDLRQKQLQSILANISTPSPPKSSPKLLPNLVLMAMAAEPTTTNSTSSSPASLTVSSPTSSSPSTSSSPGKALDAVSSPQSSSLNSSSPMSNDTTTINTPTSTSPAPVALNAVAQPNSTMDSAQNSVIIDRSTSSSITGPPTGFSSCDRAYRLLQVADLFARYNAACEARVFGIAANPDFWIRRCAKAVKAKNK